MEAPRSTKRRTAAAKTPPILLLLMLTCASQAPIASSDAITVGGKRQWTANVNYTEWAAGERFFFGDWLVFRWQKGYYDVVQVNSTDYEICSAEHPISNWSRGNRWAVELNETGRWYFICSRGYCWSGMKFSILVEPLPPPPATAPSPPSNAGSRRSTAAWTAVISAALVLVAMLPRPLG